MSTNDKDVVKLADVKAAFELLGLDPREFESTYLLEVTSQHVFAFRYLRDDAGHHYIDPGSDDGQDIASKLTTIRITQ